MHDGVSKSVSTPLDPDIMEKLDAFCATVHRNRAEVVRGLLYALLVEGKQEIFEQWREFAKNL